jgi:hypothetical protein
MWKQYSREVRAKGEEPTFTGFQTAIGDRPLTMKDALAAASRDIGAEGTIESRARQMVEDDRKYRAQAQKMGQVSGATPPLPPGFVIQGR